MGRERQLAGAARLNAQIAGEFARVKTFLQDHVAQVGV